MPTKAPCTRCGERPIVRKMVCDQCYQTVRRHTPEGKAKQRLANKRWYFNSGGKEKGLAAAKRYRERHPYWVTWCGIRKRTLDPATKNYAGYGGRGIKLHEPWINSHAAFEARLLDNLGPRPQGYSLDRIDNDGHYEPGNLRWADQRTQRYNTREAIAAREMPLLKARIEQLIALADSALEAGA